MGYLATKLSKATRTILALVLLAPASVHAASPLLPDVSGGPITDIHFLDKYLGSGGLIIVFIESIAGIIGVAMLIWGGFLLVTSGGNPDRVEQGKKAIYAAVVGLIIVICAYVIVYFAVTILGGKLTP